MHHRDRISLRAGAGRCTCRRRCQRAHRGGRESGDGQAPHSRHADRGGPRRQNKPAACLRRRQPAVRRPGDRQDPVLAQFIDQIVHRRGRDAARRAGQGQARCADRGLSARTTRDLESGDGRAAAHAHVWPARRRHPAERAGHRLDGRRRWRRLGVGDGADDARRSGAR